MELSSRQAPESGGSDRGAASGEWRSEEGNGCAPQCLGREWQDNGSLFWHTIRKSNAFGCTWRQYLFNGSAKQVVSYCCAQCNPAVRIASHRIAKRCPTAASSRAVTATITAAAGWKLLIGSFPPGLSIGLERLSSRRYNGSVARGQPARPTSAAARASALWGEGPASAHTELGWT